MNTKRKLSPNDINLLGLREKVILLHSSDNITGNMICMRAITEKEELKLDKISDKRDIYFYGDVDLNNKDDIKVIKDYNFVSKNGKSILYSKFDYENGLFRLTPQSNGVEIENVVKWGPCMDPVTWFKYHYCLLGKPAKVIVYNNQFYEQWHKRTF